MREILESITNPNSYNVFQVGLAPARNRLSRLTGVKTALLPCGSILKMYVVKAFRILFGHRGDVHFDLRGG